MLAKKLLSSYLLEEVESEFNGQIRVYQSLGSKRIIAGGLIQSGGVLANIWYKALKKIFNFQFSIFNVLILGLGGGTAASLTAKSWPKAEITGIEIDPKMIQLGKKYFELDKLPHLKIIQDDAIEFIKNKKQQNKDKYDLILVDLYQGEKIVKESENREFLIAIKKRLSNQGIVVFNRLFYDEHKGEAEGFVKLVENYFKMVDLIRAWSNLVVIGKK